MRNLRHDSRVAVAKTVLAKYVNCSLNMYATFYYMNASSCPILDCLLVRLFFLLFYEIVNKKVPCRYTTSFQCWCDVVRCMEFEMTSYVNRVSHSASLGTDPPSKPKLSNLSVPQGTEKFKSLHFYWFQSSLKTRLNS